MNLDDLTPDGGGSLRRPVLGPHGRAVATFTAHETPDPASLWTPFTRTTEQTRDGQQGSPLGGYQPGHGLEHEPLDRAERDSDHLVQNVYSHAQTARQIRAALRGGIG
jgi:hypothetical protein